jgi:hypothetical protein
MKLAVMQPYLFPYIGYFQLIYAADLFLIYDDVSYIKQGYINRNSVLSPNGPSRFTLPVPGASSYKLIRNLQFSTDVKKVLKTIEQSYAKAPYFEPVLPLISQVLEQEDRAIASVCLNSYQAICSYLGLDKQFKKTSELDYDRTASAQNRLINLCQKFGADCYINSPGGRSLYSKADFMKHGIKLNFIESLPVEYQQGNNTFEPNLSIIDVLMHCPPSEVLNMMALHELD